MDFIMANLAAIVWGVLAILFFVIEAVTVSTVSIWFVGGAVVAMLVAMIGGPIWLQLVLAIGVSGGLLVGCRKMLINTKKKSAGELPRENIKDGLEGKIGVVTTKIEPGLKGQILLDGIQWTARGLNEEESFAEKAKVIVCRVDGTCCIVDKYEIS